MWIIIRSVLKKEDEFYEPSRINNGLERRAVCVYVCVRGKYAWCSLFSNAERYTYPNLSPWSLKGFSKTKEGLVSSVWGGTRIASFRFEQSPSLPDSFFFFLPFDRILPVPHSIMRFRPNIQNPIPGKISANVPHIFHIFLRFEKLHPSIYIGEIL